MQIRVPHDKILQMINSHVKNGVPFTYKVTNQREQFKSVINNVMNKESAFPSNELNFIKQVKERIIKTEFYKEIPNKFKTKKSRGKIKYYSYNKNRKAGDVINGGYEVDLTGAYWNKLNYMGGLSEDLYAKGNIVSKESRLAAVGTLAKTTRVFQFDGKKQKELPPIKSVLTEHIWHTIAYEVGLIMTDVAKACGDDFIFFWVDAMFVTDRSVEKVKKIFAKYGYKFSVDKIKYVQFNKKGLVVKGKGKWIEKDGQRYFSTTRDFPYRPSGEPSTILSNKYI